MHFIDVFGWSATAIGLIGVWMNNRRWRACFVLWLISNAISFCIHTATGMWPMAARDGDFFLLAVHGWWLWRAGASEAALSPSTSCQQDAQ